MHSFVNLSILKGNKASVRYYILNLYRIYLLTFLSRTLWMSEHFYQIMIIQMGIGK